MLPTSSAVALLLPLISATPACSRRARPEECAAMLDRYVDMKLAADPEAASLPPSQSAAVRETKKVAKKADPSYARVERQCESEVTKAEYECAMVAKNADEWEACIE